MAERWSPRNEDHYAYDEGQLAYEERKSKHICYPSPLLAQNELTSFIGPRQACTTKVSAPCGGAVEWLTL